MKRLMLALAVLATAACTDPAATVRTAEALGMRDVKTGGYGWFVCGEDDFSATEFTATNAEGQPVEGVVCCRLIFKNCTARF